MRDKAGGFLLGLTGYRQWLGLATGLFVVWYVVFLFAVPLVRAVSALTALAHESVPLVPLVRDGTIWFAIDTVVDLGLVLSVVALFVGFGLFHRQIDTR